MKFYGWHGTSQRIEQFDPAFTGEGEDQYGSGFYFASDFDKALAYSSKGDDGKEHVVEAIIELENPIWIDGMHYSNLGHIMITNREKIEMALMHPDIYKQPCSGEGFNPLGDYISYFWDEDYWNSEDIEEMVKKMVYEYYSDASLLSFSCLFNHYETAFRWACKRVMKHDGIVVKFGDCENYVAWFPEQITVVRNWEA